MDLINRLQMAEEVERYRSNLKEALLRYPLELEWDLISGSNGRQTEGPNYCRVVLDKHEDVDKLIRQLRSERVTVDEALNKSLVWPNTK